MSPRACPADTEREIIQQVAVPVAGRPETLRDRQRDRYHGRRGDSAAREWIHPRVRPPPERCGVAVFRYVGVSVFS